MSRRSWTIYGPVAVAGLVAGGAVAFWATGSSPVHVLVPSEIAAQSDTYPQHADPQPAKARSLAAHDAAPDESASSLPLKMDKSLSTTDETDEKVRKAESLRAYMQRKKPGNSEHGQLASAGSESLNLKVPEPDPEDAIKGNDTSPHALSAEKTLADEARAQRAFDLKERAAPLRKKVASYSLFNPEYGLRGFMKQGWINDTFGVQGGLGLNDDRHIQNDSNSLRDDIAVGMGVILAF